MNVDCHTWLGLNQGLKQAAAIKAFEAVDAIEAELTGLAVKIVADPRRMNAVTADCPKIVAEVRARANAAGVPRQVANPAHDQAMASAWVGTLTEEQLVFLKEAIKANAAKRRRKKT